ncbi:MAG: hypothetical protein KDJ36_07005 [Hyphomicrobiaceae bacterium]|nr:hypothetical protein [Hyphomicrobiaceae bacterium]
MHCNVVRGVIAATMVLFTCVATLGEAAAQPANVQPEIKWRVENPFRLFKDARDTAVHHATWQALKAEDRPNPILAAERALALRHPEGWAAAMVRRVCWDSDKNRHRCGNKDSYINPRQHRIVAELTGVPDAASVRCTWLTTPRGRRVGRGQAETRRCNEPVVLTIPYPRGVSVTVRIGGRDVAGTRIRVKDVLIVGLGDSFGSGEGNPDVPVRFSRDRTASYGRFTAKLELLGYPARAGSWNEIGDRAFVESNAVWLDQACHRSLYSHQLRVALQLAIEDPHRAVTFLGYACSGAEITKGLFLRYKGHEWVPNPPDLSQISAVASAQCGGRDAELKEYPEAFHMRGAVPDLQGGVVLNKCPAEYARKIDLVLVSIGGNDIGFARLVANAVLRDQTVLKRLGGWIGEVYRKQDAAAPLDQLKSRYKALKRAVHNILHVPWTQSDRIILTAYPRMAILEDGRSVCPSSHVGMEVMPVYALNRERARDGEEVAGRLHSLMRRAAREHGWRFAERHRAAFYGRGICAGFARSALSIADDLRFPRKLNGRWAPFNPADYRAYASRQRWFRTPNDAFLTGNFHVTGSLLRRVLRQPRLLWTQVLLASTYSGAFHPTAEGHAAMADVVAEEARAVLEHYSGRNLIK